MTAALTQALPSNLEAERLTLGSVLIEPSNYGLIAAEVCAEDFSLEAHRRIFTRMGAIAERGDTIDRVGLANELMNRGELASVGGLTCLMELDAGSPRGLNWGGYVKIIQQKAALRTLIHLGEAMQTRAFVGMDSPEDIASDTEARLAALRAKTVHGLPETIDEIVQRVGMEASGTWRRFKP